MVGGAGNSPSFFGGIGTGQEYWNGNRVLEGLILLVHVQVFMSTCIQVDMSVYLRTMLAGSPKGRYSQWTDKGRFARHAVSETH